MFLFLLQKKNFKKKVKRLTSPNCRSLILILFLFLFSFCCCLFVLCVFCEVVVVVAVVDGLELRAFIGLAKLPIGRNEVIGSESVTITKSDLKGKALAIQIVVALPILAPISRHGLPSSSRPLY